METPTAPAWFVAFEALWWKDGQQVAGHLPLLGLHHCERSIAIVRAAVEVEGTVEAIVAMLAERDWRPNLVAATAVLFYPRDGRFAEALWRSLDSGSWASPQLAVALSMHDQAFVARAVDRVERGCPMTGDRWSDLAGRSAPKALSALIALLDDLAPDEARRLRATPEVTSLLGVPYEGGDRIAVGWRARITRYLAP